MSCNPYRLFVLGEVDWDAIQQRCRLYCPILAGALFGAGWWCWLDAIVYSAAVLGDKVPLVYHIPGWVATIGLIAMNLVSRDDLKHAGDAYEEGAEFRAKCWLFCSYLIASGAIAGGVVVLLKSVEAQQNVTGGVGALLQVGFVVLSSLVLWAFRTEDDSSGYGYI